MFSSSEQAKICSWSCVNLLDDSIANIFMVFVLVWSEESHAAFWALIYLHVHMTFLMVLLVAFGRKFLFTIFTFIVLLTCVNLYMLDQAAFILKFLTTYSKWALVPWTILNHLSIVCVSRILVHRQFILVSLRDHLTVFVAGTEILNFLIHFNFWNIIT